MFQQHLNYKELTNLGSFYTPNKFVIELFNIVKINVPDYENFYYLDSSCGYGSFFEVLPNNKSIGCDIDEKAIKQSKTLFPNVKYYLKNTLNRFTRRSINLKENDKLIIIGNPPYNDTTSKVKNNIKNPIPYEIDSDIKTRDLGISFMLSYNKLKADYVAILHPLSYMIKKANYNLLSPFFKNYKLIDHAIINSQEFCQASKTNGFPIIMALYKRNGEGMSYPEIENLTFKTLDNKTFDIKKDYLSNYISKYPTKTATINKNDVMFFTMRDINALSRNKTFIQKHSANAIIIDKNKFAYYCYVDVFKQYIKDLPYYYGNLDVFINNKEFLKIKDVFITNAVERNPWLKEKNIEFNYNNDQKLLDDYFKMLFGE